MPYACAGKPPQAKVTLRGRVIGPKVWISASLRALRSLTLNLIVSVLVCECCLESSSPKLEDPPCRR
eukprot:jgi/Botrbrau1/20913/Bobra.0135s0044.1